MMRPLVVPIALALLAALMGTGIYGSMFGAMVGAREVRGVPAMLGFVALLVLRDGLRALGPAAGWALLGAAGTVAMRAATDSLGRYGWMPGEDPTGPEIGLEAAWCFALALIAWRGAAWRWAGALLAACVATTRIGEYGQVLVPLTFEPTLREGVLMGLNVVAGFAAGLAVLVAAGWGVSVLARIPAGHARPGRVLAALAVAAGLGHMLRP
ncbi:hypothetical protein [Roseomonas rosulenta]|uniref:hypothetical protein n=1 Tax=Roseomonas rosulenta TaxID=2748667 RepID=UPI0018DEF725|nr:hypothetical protein [Roseomonas rosulenta]